MSNDGTDPGIIVIVWSFVCMFIGYIFGAQK